MKKITLSLLLASYSHVDASGNSIHDKLTANIHQQNLVDAHANAHAHAHVNNHQALTADIEIEVEVDAETEAGVEVEKKKKMKKKKKLLRHNPEVKVEREKLTRYDDHSIEARMDFIQ